MNNSRILKRIRSNWGKEDTRKREYNDMKLFYEFQYLTDYSVDDHTWNDLNMNDIFNKVDRTYSTVGENSLYGLLRNPIKDKGILEKRKNIIHIFQDNTEAREKIALELYKLGKTYSNINALLYSKLENKSSVKVLCYILSYSLIFSIFSLLYTRSIFNIILILTLSIINIFTHFNLSFKMNHKISSVAYLNKIIRTAQSIYKIENTEIRRYSNNIDLSIKACKKIYRKSSNIGKLEGFDLFGEYISALFLSQETSYYSLLSEIEVNKNHLINLVLFVGEIDALLSIASYRASLKEYVEPVLIDKVKILKVKDIVHPLIDKPVANSINLNNKGVIITGSNASGKSTFLKTLGINAIFAQTIYTCLADEYIGSYFQILTSINPMEDILSGKSYYMGEVDAIYRIVKKCENNISCLIIIDEIFRGTNPIERINSSAVILEYLIKRNALVIVATHDLELTKSLTDYTPYYFRENLSQNGLIFDYIIRNGISPTRNAVRLLEYTGYPTEIISEIDRRIACE